MYYDVGMEYLRARFQDGSEKEIPYGARVGAVLREFPDQSTGKLVGALVNNEVQSLSARIIVNCDLEPIPLSSPEGIRIYRNSLCFLLEMAARKLFPNRSLRISHSLGHSYYYHFSDLAEVSGNELKTLEFVMRDLERENWPITPRMVSYRDAVDWIKRIGQTDTALLLENLNKNMIRFNECRDYLSLYHNPLAESTGVCGVFELLKYQDGFLLRYPSEKSPDKLEPFEDSPKLFSIYNEHKHWGKILKVSSIGKLNSLITDKKEMDQFVQLSESLHNQKISRIADTILGKKGDVKVILIAGPSSSGKTTFTKKLAISLQVVGFKPQIVSLDDYYKPKHEAPLDDEGNPDLEALEALDVEHLNNNLVDLFKGKEVEMPLFDFKIGKRRETGKMLKMDQDTILLMEGIHGLNDRLTPLIPANQKIRIYISALTQLNLDDMNRVPTTDNRLIRRMVRDYQFRSYMAIETLKIWPSVSRGERKYIFPFQGSADLMFNSALDYELSVLKVFAEPLLRTVKPTEKEYSEACRLLSFLSNLSPIPTEMVPRYSILREFIGNSGFKY
jgi:uridine kinase